MGRKILESASLESRKNKQNRIDPHHLQQGIANDKELDKFVRDVIIAKGLAVDPTTYKSAMEEYLKQDKDITKKHEDSQVISQNRNQDKEIPKPKTHEDSQVISQNHKQDKEIPKESKQTSTSTTSTTTTTSTSDAKNSKETNG